MGAQKEAMIIAALPWLHRHFLGRLGGPFRAVLGHLGAPQTLKIDQPSLVSMRFLENVVFGSRWPSWAILSRPGGTL